MNLSDDGQRLIVFLDSKAAVVFENPFCSKLTFFLYASFDIKWFAFEFVKNLSTGKSSPALPLGATFLLFALNQPQSLPTIWHRTSFSLFSKLDLCAYCKFSRRDWPNKHLWQITVHWDWSSPFSQTYCRCPVYVSFFSPVSRFLHF